MARSILFLEGLSAHADGGLLLLRVLTGGFLVYGVIDNVASAEQMAEFSAFLAANGFAAPDLMAPLSAYLQLISGSALLLGWLTRWAGLMIAANFIIALLMVHWQQDFRGWWPAIVLVGIGIQFALTGPGRFSVDGYLGRLGPITQQAGSNLPP